ncbi:MAG TPA: thioesterase family protein [Pseudomonadales bacterium]|nr:thioesterase family protein [Pseudomonadales bacterium]
MFTWVVSPRFYETDAFGHVNNTVVPGWFETAREPIFKLFMDAEQMTKINLILARIEVDFVAQIFYGKDVTVKTGIEKIGNSSFVVWHEAWQSGILSARGKAVQVYFNHDTQKSEPIPAEYREKLAAIVSKPD